MKTGTTNPVRNGDMVALAEIPNLGLDDFREQVLQVCENNGRIAALFGQPAGADSVRLFAVLANDADGQLTLCSTEVADHYPALTPACAQAHWFEREIAEQWGVCPEGHPWLKPVRFHHSYRKGHDTWNRAADTPITPGVMDFFKMTGEEVHEVAVGPVHAGIIEPGHFRFQCHGEKVYHLEISLGYQHRGVERALVGGPNKRTIPYLETLAGDVGYLPTASFCGRIRGDFLNLTALICGNRFGRGLVRPGGVLFELDPARQTQLEERLEQARQDVTNAVNLLWDAPSVRSRFENAGPIPRDTALDLGLVGVVARASGIERDVRAQFPSGLYRFAQIPVSSYHTGNVFARAYVRWMEIQRSLAFVFDQLQALPDGPVRAETGPLAANRAVVSLVEGWRGEICHVALTDAAGKFAHYKIVDPSFYNWMGLAMALRDQQISDFPLCNKSFNLSYCGHDL